jgi:cbb3-type cytochrome oxidase maturation protein
MSVIYILIPIAIILTAIGIYLFFWAVKTEQFDDLEKQGMSILFDENPIENSNKTSNKASNNNDNKENSAVKNIKPTLKNNTDNK